MAKKTDYTTFLTLSKMLGLPCQIRTDADGLRYVYFTDANLPPHRMQARVTIEAVDAMHFLGVFNAHGVGKRLHIVAHDREQDYPGQYVADLATFKKLPKIGRAERIH